MEELSCRTLHGSIWSQIGIANVGCWKKKKKKRQVLCQIAVIQLKTIQQLDMTFFLPQKHISEAPFLRIWDFTVFVAAQHLRPTLEWSPILLLQQLLLLLPWAYI